MISVSVIPIVRGLPKDTLSYFSSLDIHEGDLVVVMIGNREVTALVVEVRPIETSKLSLKKERFQMKKVIRLLGPSPFAHAVFATAKRASTHFLTSMSTMLGLLLPRYVLDEALAQKRPAKLKPSIELPQSEKCVLQLPYKERKSLYRTLVREAFARNESCMIIAPTIIECLRTKEEVARGIDEYVYTLHSQMTGPTIKKMLKEILKSTHPVLIIATPSFSTIPRDDIRTIIIERESSSEYRTLDRNHIDWRTILEMLAEELHIRCIIADTLLRFETLYRHQLRELVELRPLAIAPREQKTFSIVNMVHDEGETKRKGSFKIFSELSLTQIQESLKMRKHVFVLTHRKGLATTTLCQDCGHICACARCGSPLVLYKGKVPKVASQSSTIKKVEERYFMCNHCRIVERSNFACPYCKSWNLKEYGFGNERIVDELKMKFGSEQVFSFDQSSIKTIHARDLFIKKFYEAEGGIFGGK
jgi:primosomal protein N' (replication factor Y)